METFRTVEISDPRFERDHLRFITLKSTHLNGRGDICVFTPPEISPYESYPVVILLHGVYGSAWTWPYKTGVHLQAHKMIQTGELPAMFIAMPSDGLWGDGSGYLPHNGKNFEKWVVEDVPLVLQQQISGITTKSPFFIAGLSMGGWGALRIGAKYGKQFKAIAGHSSITNIQQMKIFVEEDLKNFSQTDKVDEDVFKTFVRHRNQLPPVYLDCGVSDPLLEYNRDLHRLLEREGIKHIYQESPGGHEWAYWEKQIRQSLLFFARSLS